MEGQFSYQDFDLLIEPGRRAVTGPGCCVRRPGMHPSAIQAAVLGTGAGNLVLKLGQGRRTRGSRSPESAPLKDFGGKLYGAVFQDELRDALQRGLTLTHAQQAGMRLADNPELAELPWEFPYDLRRAGSCPIAPRRSHRTAEGLSEIQRHYL